MQNQTCLLRLTIASYAQLLVLDSDLRRIPSVIELAPYDLWANAGHISLKPIYYALQRANKRIANYKLTRFPVRRTASSSAKVHSSGPPRLS